MNFRGFENFKIRKRENFEENSRKFEVRQFGLHQFLGNEKFPLHYFEKKRDQVAGRLIWIKIRIVPPPWTQFTGVVPVDECDTADADIFVIVGAGARTVDIQSNKSP